MAFPSLDTTRGDFRRAASTPLWLRRVGLALLPLALLLIWTAAVRLPFYTQTDKDEFFFSVIAAEWLKGGLPYVATFDVKPPGLFFLFAAVQAVFGASLAAIKAMEIVAVALGAWGLFALLNAHGTRRTALWAATLYPVCTLTLGGAVAANMILLLPFVVASFVAVMAAVREGAGRGERLAAVFLAGLAIGAAGMVKQTAIFEAIAVFAVLCLYGDRRRLPVMVALFVTGAALPALAFALYFLAAGHLQELVNAVVVLAGQRVSADVRAAYGPEYAFYFTPLGVIEDTVLAAAPVLLLIGGALFAFLRRDRVRDVFPNRMLVVGLLWLLAALAGAMSGYVLCGYYLLTSVPPLLILAAAFFCHGLNVAPARELGAAAFSAIAVVASIAVIDRHDLFTPDAFLAGDYNATRQVSERLVALGIDPTRDRLFVLNRGYMVYADTGAFPPSPYFHATHTLGVFHTPAADPLGESLHANPRFIVIADPAIRHVTEQPEKVERALAWVAAHYRVAGTVNGARDSFTIYEFSG